MPSSVNSIALASSFTSTVEETPAFAVIGDLVPSPGDEKASSKEL